MTGKKEWRYFIAFGGLSLAGCLFLYIFPMIYSIVNTFFKMSGDVRFLGGDIYLGLFTSQAFWMAVRNTLKWILIGIPCLFFLSLWVSIETEEISVWNARVGNVILMMHLIPLVIPSAVLVNLIRILFDTSGAVNGILVSMGSEPIRWLDSGKTFWLFFVFFLWKNYGYCMVVLIGGMHTIDRESIEAAQVDGANRRQIVGKIILPQIRSFIIFVIIMGIIGIVKMFRESYLLFGDYPPDSVYMIQNFINNNFAALNYERLSAASALLFVVMGIFIFIMLRMEKGGRPL